MGVPASHNPFLCGIFHYKASIWGTPIYRNPQMKNGFGGVFIRDTLQIAIFIWMLVIDQN